MSETLSYIRERMAYFKQLPLELLSEEFIRQLSDEDQFFLLMAIKERENAKEAEQWQQVVETGVQIAVAAGAVLFLSNLFFGGSS